MKTGFYLCCVGVALIAFVEATSEQQVVLNDPIDKRGLYLESAQSQNAAAAAGAQSSSYLNVDEGHIVKPQYFAPAGWSGADGSSLQMGQQSSESAMSHASLNQYSKLIADGEYGGQVVNQYPQYLPSGLSSLQSSQSGAQAAAAAASQTSGSQFQGNVGGYSPPFYASGNSQYLQQNSQAEAAAAAQASSSNYLEQLNYHQPHAQRPFVQYPQDYYGSPSYVTGGMGGASSSSAVAGASAGTSGSSSLLGSTAGGFATGMAGGVSGASDASATASASSQSFQSQEIPVPRVKCELVRQCKTVLEPAY